MTQLAALIDKFTRFYYSWTVKFDVLQFYLNQMIFALHLNNDKLSAKNICL